MRRLLLGFLLGLVFSAGFAMADPGSAIAPAPGASAVCNDAGSPLLAGNPLEGALFLAPPNGCASICSGAQGKSCSPEGNFKSCYDVNSPDGCLGCICTANLVWNCFI
jgi:hypothetical protein